MAKKEEVALTLPTPLFAITNSINSKRVRMTEENSTNTIIRGDTVRHLMTS